ncbi:T9SS type A sorting domain-containing protein [bacterium]|nr:T9SS type A sorting domain-containing protein [bacterium]
MFRLAVCLFALLAATVAAQPSKLWDSTYGGSDVEFVECGAKMSDDAFVISGYSQSFGAPADVYVVKIDLNGNTVWSNTFGAGWYDYTRGIAESHDNQVVVAGMHELSAGANRLAWLFKTDASGAIDWQKNYYGAQSLWMGGLCATADSGFALAGWTSTAGSSDDAWLIKTNAAGDSLWSTTFGRTGVDRPYCLMQHDDGGYMIGGVSGSYGGGYYYLWIVRTNDVGDTLWTRFYGNSTASEQNPVMCRAQDGNYIFGCTSKHPTRGDLLPYFVKITPAGDTVWTKWVLYGGPAWLGSIYTSPDHGYLIGGSRSLAGVSSQMMVTKLNADFDSVWTVYTGGSGSEQAVFVHEASTREIVAIGQWDLSQTTSQYYAAKWQASILDVDDNTPIGELPDGYVLKANYPNPFNPVTTIDFSLPERTEVSIDIFNVQGQLVKRLFDGYMPAGDYSVTWNGRDQDGDPVATGVYLYRLTAGDHSQTRKMILLK